MSVGEEFCAQLTSEKLVTRRENGVPVRRWEKTRTRNEMLDAFVLALAALRLLNPPMAQWAEQIARAAQAPKAQTSDDEARKTTTRTTTATPARGRRVQHSSYLEQFR